MQLKLLLWVGVLFYLSEFFFHFFGLPVLEHDKIFIPTHDRYIALYGLTYATLLFLISTNFKKYRTLFILTMIGILFGMLNALLIAHSGGYRTQFHTFALDRNLISLGVVFGIWYALTLITGLKIKPQA